MKTLVIHPKDPTTDFLSLIYAPLEDKTVIRGGISKSDLRELIESYDRVIMLGHGSPYGLLSKGQFPDAGLFIVDESMVSALKNNSYSIFIWCYADQFIRRHGLSGLCTGMFISELGEADFWGYKGVKQDLIDESNEQFASIVSKNIYEPLDVMYNRLLIEYELLAKTNPIARFNFERLTLCNGLTSPTKRIKTWQV